MKTYSYSFLSILLLTIVLSGCSDLSEHKKKCKAVFPALNYDISKILKWDTSYSNLVFQFYSESIEKDAPWQLISYGLHYSETDSLISSKIYDKLSISTLDTSKNVSDSVIVGNNIIPLKILQTFARVAQDTPYNATQLVFIPYDTSGKFKNYILYHIKIPNNNGAAGGKYLKIDTSRVAPEFRQFIKVDPTDNSSYLELNPCPPANVDVSGINKFSEYEFLAADIRLVRSMVFAHSGSNATSTSKSTAG